MRTENRNEYEEVSWEVLLAYNHGVLIDENKVAKFEEVDARSEY
jgi:hypothetical protein